jgi:transcription elongation factor GreA
MPAKEVVLTYEGLKKLEEELDTLKTKTRKEVAEEIKQAMAFGDLSENSEYDEAKNKQAQVEARILSIENMLKNAKVIDEDDIDTNKVSVGSKVKIIDIDENEEVEYTIVGSTEADPAKFKISDESPVGAGLLGRKVDEIAEIKTPGGIVRLKIIKIYK